MSTALALALLAPLALGSDPVGTVPITKWNNLVLVPVSVHGSSPFQLVLDTAMSGPGIVLFQGKRLGALGLEFTDDDAVVAAGGDGQPLAVRRAKVSSISLGDLSLPDVFVNTFPGQPPMPADIEGAIGFEVFHRFAVRIDVDAGVLRLYDSTDFQPPRESEQVTLEIKNGFPFIEAMVAVGAEEPIKAELILDLGAVHGLWLNADPDGRFAPPAGAIETTLGYGAGGPLEGHVGRSRLVRIGAVKLENVITVFPLRHQQRPGDLGIRDGFIGADLLTCFDLTVDYPGKRILLASTGPQAPFEWDMSGLVLNTAGVVDSIIPGSPAEQAGLQVGDRLVTVDDKPIAGLLGGALRPILRRDGAEVRLTIQRNDELVEKRFRLKRLI